VGDDDDRVVALELGDELLDLQRRDGIQGGARLVHEDHLRLDRDGAGDAQALLLAAREADAGLAQAVLDLLPQPGAAQRTLDALLDVPPPPGQPQAGRDVVEDGHGRERVRLLEDHADRPAHGDDVDAVVVDVGVVEHHPPLSPWCEKGVKAPARTGSRCRSGCG
jgi:hypothetical protein